ncbi:Hif prolyl hydroxylase [Favolaschia claudopus]|uniref:Hif prolyl hydroxylase n=1 Tax=Favolaschia claudopus TaxID=2862362 RepID=A0AAW0B163_9AGAR
MSHQPPDGLCSVCNQHTSKWCSRCQRAWYCSEDHMHKVCMIVHSTALSESPIVQDWPQHQKHCHPAESESIITISPQAELACISVDAVLFPVDEDRPKIITVQCRPPQQPSRTRVCPTPMLQTYFDNPPNNMVLTQGLNKIYLRYPLQIFFSTTALSDASPENRAISKITGDTTLKQPFYGNVVALKYDGTRCSGYMSIHKNEVDSVSVPLSVYLLSLE